MSSRTAGEGSACRTVMCRGFGCVVVFPASASSGLPGKPGIFSALERGPLSFQKERGERKLLSAEANLPSGTWPGFFDEASCLVEKRRASCPPPSGSPGEDGCGGSARSSGRRVHTMEQREIPSPRRMPGSSISDRQRSRSVTCPIAAYHNPAAEIPTIFERERKSEFRPRAGCKVVASPLGTAIHDAL